MSTAPIDSYVYIYIYTNVYNTPILELTDQQRCTFGNEWIIVVVLVVTFEDHRINNFKNLFFFSLK
jgi:hypothetical protein